MSNIIKVENLSKKYIIGQQQLKGKKNFREVISQNINKLGNRLLNPFLSDNFHLNSPFEEFWALKDLCFEVDKGDRIGIIGRNGAGKSTLLKILSRITEPSGGKITIKGRVASLLEVGTGFNGELTGRENIYLNGAILGMHRAEIKHKFDEIVDFSGVEKFLDTPVKRYSSGMYVRLAFAVAAHLEPEILIVDEVLAVGDSEFQKKCLGKMEEVSQKGGRTVLFVSHNMAAIEALCQKVILLNGGVKEFDGLTNEGISQYLDQSISISSKVSLSDRKDRMGNGKVKFINFKILDKQNVYVDSLLSGNNYIFELFYKNFCNQSIKNVKVCLEILDDRENRLLVLRNDFTNEQININSDTGSIKCKIANLPLAIGIYHFVLYLSINDQETLDLIGNVKYTEVIGGNFFGTGSMGLPSHCKMLYTSEWE